ncbi:unnamed protein product [Periconia digitata]|uniref:Uncharacterized protein n=1 Tax=Periconia digitata TaxID=1303443 RepID=A0A9W4U443_9PLEO|nr:unnamed protein product [Periconia digitata]
MDIPLRPLMGKPAQPSNRLLDLFTTGGKDKPSAELRHALSLLQVRDLDSLENHFLALEAFLKPWSHYRDTYLLLRPEYPTVQQTQAVITAARADSTTKRSHILWFYTHFLNGELRYDARADETSTSFTRDETQYGQFDQSNWGQAEYEKLLYAWLLQEFKVGKTRNPYGFRYFELQNVCSAWEYVFLPIVTAVRDSYDVKGRKYYGRLANFIEERSPSRLAFPQGSSDVHAEPMSTAMPRRVMSFSKKGQRVSATAQKLSPIKSTPTRERTFITAADIAEVDAELRIVSEKYGGVIERPKYKKNIKEWLALQKDRAKQRKRFKNSADDNSGESSMFGCRGIDSPGSPTQAFQARRSKSFRSVEGGRSPVSPLSPIFAPSIGSSDGEAGSKDKSDGTKTKLKRLVPFGMYGYADADAGQPSPKSSDHGVTRFVELPETPPKPSHENTSSDVAKDEEDQPWTKPVAPFASPTFERKSSDGVYTAIRNSNPFNEDYGTPRKGLVLEEDMDDMSVYSTMGPPSAIPEPLFRRDANHSKYEEEGARRPSYEGTAYGHVMPSAFVEQKMEASPDQAQKQPQPTIILNNRPNRAPEPLHLHPITKWAIRSTESIPERTPWSGTGSPSTSSISRTGFSPGDKDFVDHGPPPPIPMRSPRRAQTVRVSSNISNGQESSSGSPRMRRILEKSMTRSSSVHSGESNLTTSSSSNAPAKISRENIRARLALSRNTVGLNSGENAAGKLATTTEVGKETEDEQKSPQRQQGNNELVGNKHEGNHASHPSTSRSHPFNTFNKHHFPHNKLGQDSPNLSPDYF